MASKHILRLGILVLLSTVGIPCLQAEVIIPPEIVAQIQALTARSFNFYPLDQAKAKAVYAKIDQWVESQIILDDEYRVKDKRSSRLTWVKLTSQNIPIFAGEPMNDGLIPPGPFRVKYVKKPQGRAFVKALRMPIAKRLTQGRIAGLARLFIEQRGFVLQTKRDTLGNPLVVARSCRAEGAQGKKNPRLTVLQRAVLKRMLDGLEVLNSRQVVDIHPQSGEILAYKHLSWAPADETRSKTVPSLPTDQVLIAIQQALKQTTRKCQVTSVKLGMYQLNGLIFPVLAVRVERESEIPEAAPLRRVLLVPLVKGITLPARAEPGELPQFLAH